MNNTINTIQNTDISFTDLNTVGITTDNFTQNIIQTKSAIPAELLKDCDSQSNDLPEREMTFDFLDIFSDEDTQSECDELSTPISLTTRESFCVKTLVLDLDETIIHTISSPNKKFLCALSELPNCLLFLPMHEMVVFIRPGLRNFLINMNKLFFICLYTNATKSYTDIIITALKLYLDGENLFYSITTRPDGTSGYGVIKRLSKICFTKNETIIVDDRLDVWKDKFSDATKNIIQIKPFFGPRVSDYMNDNELEKVTRVINEILYDYNTFKLLRGTTSLENIIYQKNFYYMISYPKEHKTEDNMFDKLQSIHASSDIPTYDFPCSQKINSTNEIFSINVVKTQSFRDLFHIT